MTGIRDDHGEGSTAGSPRIAPLVFVVLGFVAAAGCETTPEDADDGTAGTEGATAGASPDRAPERSATTESAGPDGARRAVAALRRDEERSAESPSRAPVDVSLRRTARIGESAVTFSFTAQRRIPRAKVRFVVPDGVEIVDGRSTVEFREVPKGARRTAHLKVQIPETGSFELAAGVDVLLGPNVKLHEGETVHLGDRRREDPVGRLVETPGSARDLRAQRGARLSPSDSD